MAKAFTSITVVTCTFNHEEYIEDCILSVLNQECEFPIIHLIGDDCSTDKTREVIKRYADVYPDRIVPVFNKKNIGPNANAVNLYNKVETRFIALLDGDDYWQDCTKIQKQVGFLLNNPSYSFSFHDAIVKIDDNIVNPSWLNHTAKTISTIKLRAGFPVPTASILFRNYNGLCLNKILGVVSADLYITHLLGHFGPAMNQSEEIKPSVYRQTQEGIWSSLKNNEKVKYDIQVLRQILKGLGKSEIESIKRVQKKWLSVFLSKGHHLSLIQKIHVIFDLFIISLLKSFGFLLLKVIFSGIKSVIACKKAGLGFVKGKGLS